MKKLLSILLAAVLALSALTASTADDTVAEYTFQDIPWGSSLEEVGNALIEKGLFDADKAYFFTEEIAYYGSTTVYPANISDKDEYMRSLISDGYYIDVKDVGTNIWTKINKSIGGYESEYVNLSFLHGTEDGEITNESEFVQIVVTFNEPDSDKKTIFDGLSEKLASVYGEYKEDRDISGFIVSKTWEGANDTVITLVYCAGTTKLFYAKADAWQQAEELIAIIEANKPQLEDAGL